MKNTPNLMLITLIFVPAIKRIPKIDLTFAISATSARSYRTYPLMKNTINSIINKYGTDAIHYSIIVYGSQATIHRNFGDRIPDPDSLKRLVSALPLSSGGSSVDKALEKAKQVYEGFGVRPDAEKVLVVITDKDSGLSISELKAAAKPLEKKGIRVIPVAVGSEVDPDKIGAVSTYYKVIAAPENEDPNKLGNEIMKRALKGEII
jgi:hypothetical protein